MSAKFSLDEYIDVAERISLFNERYPDGSLQTLGWDVRRVDERTFIVYRAAAYRSPDDTRPGHGTAWEPFPGPTQYTRDSELMNAETAAWGRAIVAVGIVAHRKIASKQEVKARNGESASAPTAPQLKELGRQVKMAKPTNQTLRLMLERVGVSAIAEDDLSTGLWSTKVTKQQVSGLLDMFKEGVLPTGDSDIPNDPPAEPMPGDEPPVDDVPFDVVDAEYEGTERD